jgi:hypothetical protein
MLTGGRAKRLLLRSAALCFAWPGGAAQGWRQAPDERVLEPTMSPVPSDGNASERHGQTLCWPRLNLHEHGAGPSPATPLVLEVCEALERRLERLSGHQLPPLVAEDVMEMWSDLDDAQGLLSAARDDAALSRAHRLLADLQAWLPVCEAWIGKSCQPPAAWPMLN